jgi:hypothetical protein
MDSTRDSTSDRAQHDDGYVLYMLRRRACSSPDLGRGNVVNLRRIFGSLLLWLSLASGACAQPANGPTVPGSGAPLPSTPIRQSFQNAYNDINTLYGLTVTSILSPACAGGADPTGIKDSARAFRACITSNTLVVVPPGNYRFKSTVSPPAYLNAFLDPAVLVTGLSNFAIFGYGATITIDASISTSTAFQFDQSSNFEVDGLTVNPSATGGNSSGISLSNAVNFKIRDITFGPGLTSQAFYGDWLVNGAFEHITIVAGACFDMAYLRNVKFDDVNANVPSPPSSGTCWNAINDPINSGANRTGVSFGKNDGVTVTRFNVSGYATGALVSAGLNFTFAGNHWHDNPGTSSASGIGIFIDYRNGGSFSSVGSPVTGVVIDGDDFSNNGSAGNGRGILIDSSAIANSDQIAGIIIKNSIFNNNNGYGIDLTTTSHTATLGLGQGNVFHGASQTTNVSANYIRASGSLPGVVSSPGERKSGR